jgi:hypothetical protein
MTTGAVSTGGNIHGGIRGPAPRGTFAADRLKSTDYWHHSPFTGTNH